MSHPAFEIDNWIKVKTSEVENWAIVKATTLRDNTGVRFDGLDIDAAKFYFYLKEKLNFGTPNQDFKKISRFFRQRDVSTGMEWAYLFKSKDNYLIITGDSKINIFIFSLNDSPTEIDFLLFSEEAKVRVQNYSLEKFKDIGYDIYINYSFYLKNLISDLKEKLKDNIGESPNPLHVDGNDINSLDPIVQYKYIEMSHDYNHWLKAVVEKATTSLQIRILYPIYFESLVDLAFRVNLKIRFNSKVKRYKNSEDEYKWDIFQHFAFLPFLQKVDEIIDKCARVNSVKMDEFLKHLELNNTRIERNQLLHGNSMFFRDTEPKFYQDDRYIVGLPDKFDFNKMIADSIQSTMKEDRILSSVSEYENLCEELIGVFDENESFRPIINSVAFGYNSKSGQFVSFGDINKFEDLYAPTYWKS